MDNPIVRTQIETLANAGLSTWTIPLTVRPAAGNGLLVFFCQQKASGSGAPTVTLADNEPGQLNTYTTIVSGSNTTAPGMLVRASYCHTLQYSTDAALSLVITASAAGSLSVVILEIEAQEGDRFVKDLTLFAVGPAGTSTGNSIRNRAADDSEVFDPILSFSFPPEAGFVCFTKARGVTATATAAIDGGATTGQSFVELANYTGDADHNSIAVAMLTGMENDDGFDSNSQRFGFDLSASITFRGLGITFGYQPLIVALPETPQSTHPDYCIDARKIVGGVEGESLSSLNEAHGGTAATTTGTVTIVETGGINSSRVIRVASGSIAIPYAGPIGTVAICADVDADATLVSGDSAAHPAAGALQMKLTGTNVSAQVTTTSGGTDGKVTDSSGGTGMPIAVVYICTFDNGTARLTVNGFSYTAAYVGTPNVATALSLFGTYASGSVTAGSGDLHRFAVYATPQTVAQEAQITRECSWAYGSRIGKPAALVTHDTATSVSYRAESSDGLTWTDVQRISFIAPVAGLSRDWSYEGESGGVHYFCYTENNFTHFGTTFGRAKTKDFRLFIPAGSVDCSAASGIDGLTASPWGPMCVFEDGVLIGYKVTKSNTTTEYYSPITNWPAAPTFSSPTALSGNNGDQVSIVPPGESGNPSNTLYRIYEPVGKYRTATAITGVYGSEVTLAGGVAGEGAFVLDLDSRFIFYNPSNSGMLAWVSTDNGTTFGAVQEVQGLNTDTGGPIDVGQGQPFLVDVPVTFSRFGRITLDDAALETVLPQSIQDNDAALITEL